MEILKKYAPPIAKKGKRIKLEQSINFRKFFKPPLPTVARSELNTFLKILPCGEKIHDSIGRPLFDLS